MRQYRYMKLGLACCMCNVMLQHVGASAWHAIATFSYDDLVHKYHKVFACRSPDKKKSYQQHWPAIKLVLRCSKILIQIKLTMFGA